MTCDVGLIGLAVMGENLALNMESRGFSVCVYNRTTERINHFMNGRAQGCQVPTLYRAGIGLRRRVRGADIRSAPAVRSTR